MIDDFYWSKEYTIAIDNLNDLDTRDLVVPFDTKDASQAVLLQHFQAFHVGSGDGPGLAAVEQGRKGIRVTYILSLVFSRTFALVGEHRRALRVRAKLSIVDALS